MREDHEAEAARLRKELLQSQQVCELHRKMGEDTEFEVRELKRKTEELKKRLESYNTSYDMLAARILQEGSADLKADLRSCDDALKSVKDLLSRI